MNIDKKSNNKLLTSATREQQQWFAVGIFPLVLRLGLIAIIRDLQSALR